MSRLTLIARLFAGCAAAALAVVVVVAFATHASSPFTMTYVDVSQVPQTTFSLPATLLIPNISEQQAATLAESSMWGGTPPPARYTPRPREMKLAMVSRNGTSCLCWVVDLTGPGVASPYYTLWFIDAVSGDTWWNLSYYPFR